MRTIFPCSCCGVELSNEEFFNSPELGGVCLKCFIAHQEEFDDWSDML